MFLTKKAYNEAAVLISTYDDRIADVTMTLNDAIAIQVREQRDQLLKDSDWTQLPDTPADKEAWAAYRQALRDLPEAAAFPNVAMPAMPS